MESINRIFMNSAYKIARQIKAKAIMLYADMASDLLTSQDNKNKFDIIISRNGEIFIHIENPI